MNPDAKPLYNAVVPADPADTRDDKLIRTVRERIRARDAVRTARHNLKLAQSSLKRALDVLDEANDCYDDRITDAMDGIVESLNTESTFREALDVLKDTSGL